MSAAEEAELAALVARVAPLLTAPPPYPPAAPEQHQSREEWLAEAAARRAQADALALEGARRAGVWAGFEFTPVASVTYHQVGRAVARVYAPEGTGPFGSLLFLHGGAWWMGGGAAGFDLNDTMCRCLCAGAGVVVANLDYRLAPEHPFPAALDDVLAGIGWLGQAPEGPPEASPEGLPPLDPRRVGILGISSGGNLAAAAALAARDRLRAQLLLAPSLDMTGSSPSLLADPVWRGASMGARSLYLGQTPLTDPRVSPLHAGDYSGLPPTTIVVGTADPLRDDGRRYAAALAEADVPVRLHEYVMTHTAATSAVTRAFVSALVSAARETLSPSV